MTSEARLRTSACVSIRSKFLTPMLLLEIPFRFCPTHIGSTIHLKSCGRPIKIFAEIPFHEVHRREILVELYEILQIQGVSFKFECKIDYISEKTNELILKNSNEKIPYDLLLCADGSHSIGRLELERITGLDGFTDFKINHHWRYFTIESSLLDLEKRGGHMW